MRGLCLLLPLVIVLVCPFAASPVSPLYFHTRVDAHIEAHVEKIFYTETSEVDTNRLMQRNTEARSLRSVKVQKILLRVLKVIRLEKKDPRVPGLAAGQSVEITNPFVDQQPRFKEGDSIRAGIRLVTSAEEYQPQESGQQWWFLPRGEPEGIGAPRRPFEGIAILPDHR